MQLIAIAAIALLVIVIGRWLIDSHGKDNEQLRKLVHIVHGVGLAALAFVVPLEFIIAIEILFLFSMLIARYVSKYFSRIVWIQYFGRMYKVGRLSYGEFFFPLSAIALVFLSNSEWEFAASILILGVADALAAVIGKKFGGSNTYLVFGQKKSVIGTLVFFVIALSIVAVFCVIGNVAFSGVTIGLVVLTTILVTIAENLGVYGSDNLLIPVVAVLLLNRL